MCLRFSQLGITKESASVEAMHRPPIHQYSLQTQISIYTPTSASSILPLTRNTADRSEYSDKMALQTQEVLGKVAKYINGLELGEKVREMLGDLTQARSLSHPL